MRSTIIFALALTACSSAPDPIPESQSKRSEALATANVTNTGIFDIRWNGVNLTQGVGGYYIIGSCTGADNQENVASVGSDGHTLTAPGSCPGAPFSLQVTGNNPWTVEITIGPLPVDYTTLSVPLDPAPQYFDSFSFDGTSY